MRKKESIKGRKWGRKKWDGKGARKEGNELGIEWERKRAGKAG